MQKIYLKHFGEQFETWGKNWDTSEKIADQMLEILETKKEIDHKYDITEGHTYLYEIEINGEIKYLLIGIGDNGFIKTAHPYNSNKIL